MDYYFCNKTHAHTYSQHMSKLYVCFCWFLWSIDAMVATVEAIDQKQQKS